MIFSNRFYKLALSRSSSLTLLSLVSLSALLNANCSAEPTTLCKKQHRQQGAPFNYSICKVSDASKMKLYWWNTASKHPFYTFANLKKQLKAQGATLRFAMNAGMYDKDYGPLALYVENSKKYKSLNQKKGGGNFHLLPNGVFWIDQKGVAHVTETNNYAKKNPQATFATQSGPMLVINGKLHPKFKKNSTSLKMRNGVGICKSSDGQTSTIFVISDEWVNFYEFASLFKDTLNCNNALFLDGGRASALYSDDLSRHDKKYMGVMIGVTTSK